MKKTSSGETLNRYRKGFSFWNGPGAFWRNNPLYSEKVKAYFENWLSNMRASEKSLTRLQENSLKGNGVRV